MIIKVKTSDMSRADWLSERRKSIGGSEIGSILGLNKYAPLKSDFVRAISTDETIKDTISDDMFTEPDITIVDSETGEVVAASEGGET